MEITNPVTDYIPKSILTTQGDLVVKGVAQPERLAQRACCYVRRNGVQAIPSGAPTAVQFNDVVFDRNGDFDITTNYRFDVPRTGYYLVTGMVRWNNGAAGINYYTRVWVPTLYYGEFYTRSKDNQQLTQPMSVIVPAAAGNYIQFWIEQNSGGAVNILGSSMVQTFCCIYELI
jgi:hypothetical protein